ncbi:MAG TPA: flagellar motor protein MotB, partial [Sphingomicrobium sp.]|nr:flagellar motor protein MotB [Sphingomicrobium sp.]
MKRNLLLATAATVAVVIASPAAATRDNSGYVGIEGGVMFPQSQSLFGTIVFTNPATTGFARQNIGSVRYRTGYDVDVIGGYSFGMFRLEGELGYKRAKMKNPVLSPAFVTAFGTGSGYPTSSAYTTGNSFNLRYYTGVYSAMVNGLVDFGGNGSFGGYVGGGAGYAHVKQFNGSKSGFAWQLLAGVYAPVSDNIDIGLKYRY